MGLGARSRLSDRDLRKAYREQKQNTLRFTSLSTQTKETICTRFPSSSLNPAKRPWKRTYKPPKPQCSVANLERKPRNLVERRIHSDTGLNRVCPPHAQRAQKTTRVAQIGRQGPSVRLRRIEQRIRPAPILQDSGHEPAGQSARARLQWRIINPGAKQLMREHNRASYPIRFSSIAQTALPVKVRAARLDRRRDVAQPKRSPESVAQRVSAENSKMILVAQNVEGRIAGLDLPRTSE